MIKNRSVFNVPPDWCLRELFVWGKDYSISEKDEEFHLFVNLINTRESKRKYIYKK
jgi:hypothetical protein